MKIYILLLLLLLIACIRTIEQDPITEDEIITDVTGEINTTKELLTTKYKGVYGVYNFSEFKVDNCDNLIKEYSLLLSEEEPRLNRRKNNIQEARLDLKEAEEELKIIFPSGDETKINIQKKVVKKLNETAFLKEDELKETKEYFSKIKYSLKLIKDECNRLSSY